MERESDGARAKEEVVDGALKGGPYAIFYFPFLSPTFLPPFLSPTFLPRLLDSSF